MKLQRRKNQWTPPNPHAILGYVKFYLDHVQQAEKGADMDILVGGSGTEVQRKIS